MKINSLEVVCPHCFEPLHNSVNVRGGGGPKAGHTVMCDECGDWAIISKDKTLRIPMPDEVLKIAMDETARALFEAWATANNDSDPYWKPRMQAALQKSIVSAVHAVLESLKT